jgi:hypothetical protein
MIVEVLANPRTIQTQFGPMQATHRAWGSTHQPWNGSVQSYSVLGFLLDGKFKALPNTEEYETIEGADYAELRAPNDEGKQADAFRNGDVVALHKAIRRRRLEEEQAAQAGASAPEVPLG